MDDIDYAASVPPRIHSTKKCPECLTQIELEATRCHMCKSKVSVVDEKTGMAKRTINWSAYFICLLAWIAFGIYIWVAFLKDKP